MPRHRPSFGSSGRQLAAGLATIAVWAPLLAGCGDDGSPPEDVAVDSSLVQVLVDLHLADARASLAEDIALGDSLRTLVYDAHRLDSTQLHSRLAQVTERPGAASALAEAVETQLSTERRAPSP